MASLEILLLALFVIATAIAALESDDLSHAIVFLALSAMGIGTIFFFVGAIYAALFEFLIYGGVLFILFMVMASFTAEKEVQA